jgi:hypothetical protein
MGEIANPQGGVLEGRPAAGLHDVAAERASAASVRRARRGLFAGGTDGNERLTVQVGALLLVLLAALGVTIIRIGQLTWLHMFLGLLLIGPVVLKMSSTGYRFARYYTATAAYRRKGPPVIALRVLGPVVVLSTVGVLATGVVLLALGPSSRDTWLLPHKVFFFVWLAAIAVHVLGHLPEMRHGLLGARRTRAEVLASGAAGASGRSGASAPPRPLGARISIAGYALAARVGGSSGRALAISGALAAGLVLALALIPHFGPWVHDHGHHHH